MSASREKKQRQSAGPSEKAAKVQEEQAARKRQAIIYSVTGGIIAVLVIALLVWRTGFFQARTAAVTVGDETLTAAELGFYYNSARSIYAQYGLLDSSKSDDEQMYSEPDNKTYRDFFMETALTDAQQHLALAKEAANAGHTEAEIKDRLDAQVQSAKDTAASYGYSYSAYLKAMYGDYMTSSIFEKLTTRYLMASLAANDKYDELYDSYAQSDLDAYYKEHSDDLDTVEYSFLYFAIPTVNSKDADGNELAEDEVQKLKDEAQAEAKEKAAAALRAVESGASFDSQAEKYELTTAANHGDHSKAVGTGSVNSTYSEELFKLKKDECKLVESENGYYVISFHDRYLADEPTQNVRHILARAEHTTDDANKLVAPTDEAWTAAKAKMDEIQAAWEGGAKTEDAFAALANEKSDDGDGATGGLYTRVPKNPAYGSFVSELDAWMYDGSRQPGDVAMIQHSAEEGANSGYYGYHLIYYVGENEPVWMGTVRDTMASEAQQSWIDGLAKDFPTTLQSGANYFGK